MVMHTPAFPEVWYNTAGTATEKLARKKPNILLVEYTDNGQNSPAGKEIQSSVKGAHVLHAKDPPMLIPGISQLSKNGPKQVNTIVLLHKISGPIV